MTPDDLVDQIRAGADAALAAAFGRWGHIHGFTTIDFESVANESAAKAWATWNPNGGRTPSSWGYLRAMYDFREHIRSTTGTRRLHHITLVPFDSFEPIIDDPLMECVDHPFPTGDELVELCGSFTAASTIDRLIRGVRTTDIAAADGVTIAAVSHRVKAVQKRVTAIMAVA